MVSYFPAATSTPTSQVPDPNEVSGPSGSAGAPANCTVGHIALCAVAVMIAAASTLPCVLSVLRNSTISSRVRDAASEHTVWPIRSICSSVSVLVSCLLIRVRNRAPGLSCVVGT